MYVCHLRSVGLKGGLFRFRPNIVIKGGSPFVEDNITELAITSDEEPANGASAIHLVSKCTRCLVRGLIS